MLSFYWCLSFISSFKKKKLQKFEKKKREREENKKRKEKKVGCLIFEGGINKVSVERVEELKGLMEVVAVCMEGDDGVPNDDILVPR